MTTSTKRRATACSGALMLALGAGVVLAPTATAATPPAALGSTTSGPTSGIAGTTGSITSGAVGTTVPVVTPVVAAVTASPSTAGTAGTGTGTGALPDLTLLPTGTGGSAASTSSGSGSTTVSLVNGADGGSAVSVTLGAGGAGTSGASVGGTVGDAAGGLTSGSIGSSGASGSSGAVDVAVGGTVSSGTDAEAAPVVRIPTVSAPAVSEPAAATAPASVIATDPGAGPAAATPVSGVPAVVVQAPSAAAATPTTGPSAAPSSGVPTTSVPSSPQSVAPVVAHLLSLAATSSVATVFPVKDGYRDDVVFHLKAATSTGQDLPVEGTAVLRRGTRAVARWTIGRSTQDLHWNGRDAGKVVGGTYALLATVHDATGATHTTTARVTASAKQLVASTKRYSVLAVSGRHAMAAEPRAALGRGRVTLRVTTVATKVQGRHFLSFVKDGQRFRIAVRAGTHTSRAITVPRSFTSFTLQHTWRKGQVALKTIRYTYSFQTLR